ncbi:hypothetical protein [Rhodococcus sp. 06-1460-1B]|uniref:hypothetical protein n=1 Tax=Rhodococcus sp. 06-1460-1B TaxID=2022501 RepID=UPI00113FF4F6|nr:hypothetical protein [Rhodococcus sp. 06-1460-1B]
MTTPLPAATLSSLPTQSMGLTQTHGLTTLESGAAERGYLHPIQVDWEATGAHAELLRPSHETGLNPAANARAFVEWPSLAVEIGDESART